MGDSRRTPEPTELPAVLASLWRWWAERAGGLQVEQLAMPTRCPPWMVHDLLAHVTPDPDRLQAVLGSPVGGDDAAGDAAAVLRAFNAPGGLAHVRADDIASAATAAVAGLSLADVVRRFDEAVAVVESIPFDPTLTLPYPGVAAITAAALTQLAIVEGTVHALDLNAAVGGDLPPTEARACALDVLVRIPDDTVLLDALTGRRDAAGVLPVLR